MSDSQNLIQNDLNQAKQYTQKTIEELTQSMSSCRQRLQENPQSGQTQNLYNKNQQLIDSSKQQIHHIVNEYFKDISDNYVHLQSKYPNKQVKGCYHIPLSP